MKDSAYSTLAVPRGGGGGEEHLVTFLDCFGPNLGEWVDWNVKCHV